MMENTLIVQLINQIREHPDCLVIPPSLKRLELPQGLFIPDDLQEFYSMCNGLTLFETAEYTYRILGVEEVLPLDRIYYGECFCNDGVISGSWFFIAENWNADKIAIDTHPSRLGRCYDCFVGEDYLVIAKSFSELLAALYNNKGDYTYWLKSDFQRQDPCIF
jgi:antitoxin YokJ